MLSPNTSAQDDEMFQEDNYDPHNRNRYELSDMEISVLSKRSEGSLLNTLQHREPRFTEMMERRSSHEKILKIGGNVPLSKEDKNYTYDSENNFIGNSNYMDSKFMSGDGGEKFYDSETDKKKR